jgi:hypothetical protein
MDRWKYRYQIITYPVISIPEISGDFGAKTFSPREYLNHVSMKNTRAKKSSTGINTVTIVSAPGSSLRD